VRRLTLASSIFGFVFLLLLAGMQRKDHVACPDWDVYVSDENKSPMPDLAVHIAPMDPTVKDDYATAGLITDANGHVVVPRRVI
jgi:hypothetical protein